MLNAERTREPLYRKRLAPRLRPQSVIDRDRDELRPAPQRLAPARCEHQERGRVRTARDSENKNRAVGEIGEQRSDFGGGER